MDFGSFPPEINSANMYAGPGSGPMLVAAEGWQQLAGELSSAAASCSSAVADLTSGAWAGPSSVAMTAAMAPYVTWLSATAAQAEQAGSQATAAVAAYEAAFAATVPPPVIAANRSLLAALVTTNFFGQNTPAIAATEAHYGEMWAQDAAAMYGYAAASSAATQVTPFAPPPQTTDQAGLAGQAVASAQGSSVEMGSAVTATPQVLQGLAAPQGVALPAAAESTGSTASMSSLSSLSMMAMPARMAMMPMSMLMRMFMMGGANGASKASTGLAATSTGVGAASSVVSGGLGSAPLAGPATGAAPALSMGQAPSIGTLSVPPAWTAMGSATNPATGALSGTGLSALPAVEGGRPALPPMMPVTSVGGRGGVGGSAAHYDFRPTVIPRSPAAG